MGTDDDLLASAEAIICILDGELLHCVVAACPSYCSDAALYLTVDPSRDPYHSSGSVITRTEGEGMIHTHVYVRLMTCERCLRAAAHASVLECRCVHGAESEAVLALAGCDYQQAPASVTGV